MSEQTIGSRASSLYQIWPSCKKFGHPCDKGWESLKNLADDSKEDSANGSLCHCACANLLIQTAANMFAFWITSDWVEWDWWWNNSSWDALLSFLSNTTVLLLPAPPAAMAGSLMCANLLSPLIKTSGVELALLTLASVGVKFCAAHISFQLPQKLGEIRGRGRRQLHRTRRRSLGHANTYWIIINTI